MELPKIYQNRNVTNNNQIESNNNTIINKSNNINDYYHKKVKITLNNQTITTYVLGITPYNLVTKDLIIKLTDIKDIIEL